MKSLPSKTLLLCFVLLQASFAALAANISGSITCGGKGVPGVVVSDGYAFATTNAQGHYVLTSDKKNGYVFNYDKAWKVRIFEDGRELPVKRIKSEDPCATKSYDIPMFKKKGSYGDGNATRANTHMFSAVASKPNGKITVKVTDRFGRTYTSVKQLPIACTIEALAPSGK